METNDAFQRQVSKAIIQLRTHSPFFATLALFASIIPTEQYPTAATDGRDIYINRDFWSKLTSSERLGLVAHEVLHAALLHVPRMAKRDRILWNVAADVVVNGIVLAQDGFSLPDGHIRDKKLEHLSVEEVYHILDSNPKLRKQLRLLFGDLIKPLKGFTATERAALEQHWQQAMEQAKTLTEMFGQGMLPAGLRRELEHIKPAQLDWRAHLWRFLVQTPNDFQGFDRRFVGRGLYLDVLEGEQLHVFLAVDTSGSISGEMMSQFLGEVQAILSAYPHLKATLYYADAAVYGPYDLTPQSELPKPLGGGGTDFRPFFDTVASQLTSNTEGVCIYLTDGYGFFPEQPPSLPVLWVLSPGGISTDAVPFGEAVRLIP